jgi:hypothetical protein
MNPILAGALLGLIWGILLLVNFTTPPGTFLSLPFGIWCVLGIALLFVCGAIAWVVGWFLPKK